ncbi:hypothetical protein DKX38_023668 [Salix brachista]|uniref:Uncharacterized protein n=1 Tax=Salix brachista TaxID=2182728 RepID=A0A5N5JJE3_9ROSI|nr:hypothetical protein DKX38_023668 [Salix brachista]
MAPYKKKASSGKTAEVEKQSFLTVSSSDTEFMGDIRGAPEFYALVVKALVVEGEVEASKRFREDFHNNAEKYGRVRFEEDPAIMPM